MRIFSRLRIKQPSLNDQQGSELRLLSFNFFNHHFTSFNSCFYATVNSATSFSCVISNWVSFAITNSVNAIASYAIFVNQYGTNSVGATGRQTLVVSISTNGVGIAFNGGAGLWLLVHEVS